MSDPSSRDSVQQQILAYERWGQGDTQLYNGHVVWSDRSSLSNSVALFSSQRDGMVRFQKEEEEKTLKAITLFCFPEGINWAPLTEYHRFLSDDVTF